VATTGGSDEKVALCHDLGADLAVNYKTQEVDEHLRRFAPDGVNVWWETLREPNFDWIVDRLSLGGRAVIMAGREARPEFPVGPFYVKDCKLFGFAMFNAPPEQQRRAAEEINRWMNEGKLKPRIDRILPLGEAAEAHRIQEDSTLHHTGTLAGKIVLRPDRS
jgi:NADPH2:quinone reductase